MSVSAGKAVSELRLKGTGGAQALFLPVVAVVLTAGAAGLVALLMLNPPDEGLAVFTGFAAVCVGLSAVFWVVAVMSVLRHRRFGVSWLVLAETPRVGGALCGYVDARLPTMPLETSVVVQVRGFRSRTTHRTIQRHGKDDEHESHTQRTSLWSADTSVPFSETRSEGRRRHVPFRFDVPADLPAAATWKEGDDDLEVAYELTAYAALPGVDYHETWLQLPIGLASD